MLGGAGNGRSRQQHYGHTRTQHPPVAWILRRHRLVSQGSNGAEELGGRKTPFRKMTFQAPFWWKRYMYIHIFLPCNILTALNSSTESLKLNTWSQASSASCAKAPTGLITTCNGVRMERPSAAMCLVIRLKRWSKTPPTMSNSRFWSLNMLSSLSNEPVPSGPPALKKRPCPRDPPGPRPGNPATASPLPGQPTRRRGGPANGSTGAHGPLQVGQCAGGLAAAAGRRSNRRCLPTPAGPALQRAGQHAGGGHVWFVPLGARLLLPRREKVGALPCRCRVGAGYRAHPRLNPFDVSGGSR